MPAETIRVPRFALVGAAVLIVFTISISIAARQVGEGLFRPAVAATVSERTVRFAAGPEGTMHALAEDGTPLATYVPEGNTFAITAVAALGKRVGETLDTGVTLAVRRTADGRTVLADPVTGKALPLAGFGPDNIATLDRLIDAGR